MPLEKDLKALITKAGVPAGLETWLEAEGLESTEDFAVICDAESEVIEKIVVPAGLDKAVLKIVVGCKKLWRWARAANSTSTTPAAGSAGGILLDDDAPLNAGVREAVDKAWFLKWNFHLPGFRVMTESGFNRIYRQLNDRPKRLELIHLENVKLQSSIQSSELSGTMISGGKIHSFKRDVSEVEAHHDFWLRVNAVFSTICLAMIETDKWFDYGTLERFIYRLFDIVFRKVDHQRAPMSFLNQAYMIMFTEMAEKLRTDKDMTLNVIIARADWERHFVCYKPGLVALEDRSRGRSRSPRRGSDDAHGVDDQVKETLKLSRSMQSKMDSQAHELRKLKEQNAALKTKKPYKHDKGKGGKGGKGGGGDGDKKWDNDKRDGAKRGKRR